MINVHEFIKEVIVTTCAELTYGFDDDHFDVLRNWILTLRAVHRPQNIHADEVVAAYWAPIAKDDLLYDFVTRGTIIFSAILDARKQVIDTVGWKQTLSDSLSGLYATKRSVRGSRSFVDIQFAEKLPSQEYIRSVLSTESWLMFVLTLDMFLSHLPLGQNNGTATA